MLHDTRFLVSYALRTMSPGVLWTTLKHTFPSIIRGSRKQKKQTQAIKTHVYTFASHMTR